VKCVLGTRKVHILAFNFNTTFVFYTKGVMFNFPTDCLNLIVISLLYVDVLSPDVSEFYYPVIAVVPITIPQAE